MTAVTYSPGSLVRARGREWIVLPGSEPRILHLRPIAGSEEDRARIHLDLEPGTVEEAVFPLPRVDQHGSHESAVLLRDALLLSLRRGAGPFRGFGQIAVEPRAYQLVPLLMALKLDPVRLLIADDVGVGKTIEAALIARELLDRGDVARTAVLCPPHLVEQWVDELEDHFHIQAVAVTSGSAHRLERDIPQSTSLFSVYPHTVVSLDYIKSEKRRGDFLRACPEFVIVDEAHTCAGSGRGRHHRYALLKGLSEAADRHLVLLTATPHNGDEGAFYRLLGLLDPDFETLAVLEGEERERLRERLAHHFVQRRREDIQEWQGGLFPLRVSTEETYRLTGDWQRFFDAVLDYCAAVVESAEGDARRQRLSFWGTLALCRCAASSPAAAVRALKKRALGEGLDSEEESLLLEQIFDGSDDALSGDDVEPPATVVDDPVLHDLIRQAEALRGRKGDPKLKLLERHLGGLLDDGFSPVVFCRYIATAHYLGEQLRKKKAFKKVEVAVVTGELPPDDRKEKVSRLGDAESRLLIATDCLSEGINLQESFDAVVHYDLSWNPTRHEQREGRVDRFGQRREEVRATLIYGADNPVDGAVLQVILRKAEKIRRELGIYLPLPDDGHSLTQALMKAVLLRRGQTRQQALDFTELDEAEHLDSRWEEAKEKARRGRRVQRTRFAQRRLKPEEVLPEWHKSLSAVGGRDDVRRFTERAFARLGSGLEPLPGDGAKAPLAALPDAVRERLQAEDLSGTLRLHFDYPAPAGRRSIQRSHPLVSVLAETLLERTLSPPDEEERPDDPGVLGRAGVWISEAVETHTTVVLLRLRHSLSVRRTGRDSSTLLVDEAALAAWSGFSRGDLLTGEAVGELLTSPAVGDPPLHVGERAVSRSLELVAERRTDLAAFGDRRAEALLADHRRVRDASAARGTYTVESLQPVDVVAVFALLPRVR